MAKFQVAVRVNRGRLDMLRREMQLRARAHTRTTGTNIQQRASHFAPRDTGSLANSVYMTDGETSDYAQKAASARALNRDVEILPEVRPENAISLSGGEAGYSLVVAVAVAHGDPVEFGTRFMAAQPYMRPALEPERDDFVQLMHSVADV